MNQEPTLPEVRLRELVRIAIFAVGNNKAFEFSDVKTFLCERYDMDNNRDWSDVQLHLSRFAAGPNKSRIIYLDKNNKYKILKKPLPQTVHQTRNLQHRGVNNFPVFLNEVMGNEEFEIQDWDHFHPENELNAVDINGWRLQNVSLQISFSLPIVILVCGILIGLVSVKLCKYLSNYSVEMDYKVLPENNGLYEALEKLVTKMHQIITSEKQQIDNLDSRNNSHDTGLKPIRISLLTSQLNYCSQHVKNKLIQPTEIKELFHPIENHEGQIETVETSHDYENDSIHLCNKLDNTSMNLERENIAVMDNIIQNSASETVGNNSCNIDPYEISIQITKDIKEKREIRNKFADQPKCHLLQGVKIKEQCFNRRRNSMESLNDLHYSKKEIINKFTGHSKSYHLLEGAKAKEQCFNRRRNSTESLNDLYYIKKE